MLMKVFAGPVIVLYFVFLSAGITVIFYPQLKQGMARLFSPTQWEFYKDLTGIHTSK
jgi:hypothetical protein